MWSVVCWVWYNLLFCATYCLLIKALSMQAHSEFVVCTAGDILI